MAMDKPMGSAFQHFWDPTLTVIFVSNSKNGLSPLPPVQINDSITWIAQTDDWIQISYLPLVENRYIP